MSLLTYHWRNTVNITLTKSQRRQVAEELVAEGHVLSLEPHVRVVISIALQHELEQIKAEYEAGEGLVNRQEAGHGVLRVLRKVSPEAAEAWVKRHGTPWSWTREPVET